MEPTSKLRFIERVVPAPEHGEGIGKTIRILQQWWAPKINVGWADLEIGSGEWRDVPLEKE